MEDYSLFHRLGADRSAKLISRVVANGPRCMLFSGSSDGFVPLAGAFSGEHGEWTTANWTSMPQAFRKNGYFTLGTGKVFHDGTGGVLPGWTGPGMPPLQDPPSWSPGCSMQDVDSAAYMWGCPWMQTTVDSNTATPGLVAPDTVVGTELAIVSLNSLPEDYWIK